MLKFYSVNYTLPQAGQRYDKIVTASKKVSENRCIKPLDSNLHQRLTLPG